MPEPVGTASVVVQDPAPPDSVTVHSGWRTPGVVMVTVPVGVTPATWGATVTVKLCGWPYVGLEVVGVTVVVVVAFWTLVRVVPVPWGNWRHPSRWR